MTEAEQALTRAIGERLRAARRARKMSLAELSLRTGDLLSKSRISNYEQGLRRMSTEVALILADALEIVSATNLLCLDDDHPDGLTADEFKLLWKFRRLDDDWRRRVLSVAEHVPDRGSVGP
jgi:transcriptional regulator with XRE-family HTH domain